MQLAKQLLLLDGCKLTLAGWKLLPPIQPILTGTQSPSAGTPTRYTIAIVAMALSTYLY